MTPEQFVSILGAFTALIVAVGAILRQLRQTHELVNSRMDQLLTLARASSFAEGHLSGEKSMGRRWTDTLRGAEPPPFVDT